MSANRNLSEPVRLARAVKEEGSLRLSSTPAAAIRPPVGTYRQSFDDIMTQRLTGVATTPARLAKTVAREARLNEPAITSDIVKMADAQGADLKELNNNLKTEASIAKKIVKDTADGKLTIQQAASKVSDSVRYTFMFDNDRYTDGIRNTLNYFLSKGYKVRFNNSWLPETYPSGFIEYRGINAKFTSPEGFTFEVQFHSTESRYVMAETPSHEIYKETPTTPEGITDRQQRLHALWKDVTVPKGADQLRQEQFR
jgi:hypothetical protein